MRPEECSVHTHSTLCDGKGTPEEMANAAFASGVKYFGISCHSHTPLDFDAGMVLDADMAAYRETVLRLREQYKGRMEVLLGIEWDSCSDIRPEGFDYWIGSVHYQRGSNGKFYAVDWDDAHFFACRDEVCGGDALAVTEGYYAEVARVAAMKPPILGHIDLITKLNGGNRLFDEDSPRYKAAALQALHAADPCFTVLEINTGAMSRGYRNTPYPAQFLLQEWRRMGGEVIITSDSHSPDTVVYGYGEAIEAARAAGYDHTVILTRSGFQSCPI